MAQVCRRAGLSDSQCQASAPNTLTWGRWTAELDHPISRMGPTRGSSIAGGTSSRLRYSITGRLGRADRRNDPGPKPKEAQLVAAQPPVRPPRGSRERFACCLLTPCASTSGRATARHTGQSQSHRHHDVPFRYRRLAPQVRSRGSRPCACRPRRPRRRSAETASGIKNLVNHSLTRGFIGAREERVCQLNGVTGLCCHAALGRLRRPSNRMSNALRACFHRWVQRALPLPVGSRVITAR